MVQHLSISQAIIQPGTGIVRSGVAAGTATTASGEATRPVTSQDSTTAICMAVSMVGITDTTTITICTIVLTEAPTIMVTAAAEGALSEEPPAAAANRHLPKFLKIGHAVMNPEGGRYLPMPAKAWQGNQGANAGLKLLHRLPHRDAHRQLKGKELKPQRLHGLKEPPPVKANTADLKGSAAKVRKQAVTHVLNAQL